LAGELGQLPPLAFLHASRARLRAARGEAPGCHADVEAARAIAQPRSMHSIEAYCLSASGLLALGGGDHEEAAALLTELRRSVEQHGQRHPSLVPWVSELTEALCRLDREDEARQVLDDVAPWCAGPAGTALLARTRALLPGRDFEPAYAEAADCAVAFPQAFEDARLRLSLGERRRRASRSRDARAPLRAALTAFERMGAQPWVERAAAELRAAGGERSADGGVAELTPQQLEIARSVARGARNREVAAALFLSEKTVEYHLSRIYRVLGVRSRTELAHTLAEDNQGFP
jgi:DNA-binding CsgD family transcriptional regulator